jgi:hypothetical protein
MKIGNIVLSAAALVVTVGSALAFKARVGATRLLVKTSAGKCRTCANIYHVVGKTGKAVSCLTVSGSARVAGAGLNQNTFYTTANSAHACAGATINVTTNF